ncbi:MAG: winged helix-turn-helix domain-containing protein, partial [Actinomycetota bacterium]
LNVQVQTNEDSLPPQTTVRDIGEAPSAEASKPARLTVGSLELDVEGYRAFFGGRELAVSASQMELLTILISNRGRVVSRIELSEALGLVRARSVDVILSSLRKEIGRDFVRNVRRRGWIVVADELD